jgi:hypothetical protein
MSAVNAAVIGAISAEEANRGPRVSHEERGDPGAVLQPRLVQVQVHPVDRLDLEQHVTSQHISSRTR